MMRPQKSFIAVFAFLAMTSAFADAESTEDQSIKASSELTIISLAPHLTEWVYSLGLEQHLVAVSDYSDYPSEATSLPRVADYQGADIAAIVALKPTLVLAWDGGNKPQDIHKLQALGINVFSSRITNLSDIASELIKLGKLTDKETAATRLAHQFQAGISALEQQYDAAPRKSVFYYSWTAPLMTIGPNAWPNKLLNVCGAKTAFEDSPVDYPQVSVKEVLTKQPTALIAASKSTPEELAYFWAPHRDFLQAPLVTVNPDITSRFSLRLINELKNLCNGIN
ncbi:cobalamin-binding protein [Alteromonas sp. MTD1]|uniref:cobalamin-binding protein n=1 Tax=Alteromonas sp. MTD1 TaxID=3057962 RepID=UPI0036F3047E